MEKIDLTGKKFGSLMVLNDSRKRTKAGEILWRCQCDCHKKNVLDVRGYNLRNGLTRSCGCLVLKTNTKHGDGGKTKLYRTWLNIKQRCSNKKLREYKWYGKRGIKVCKEWMNDFQKFKQWALKNGYKPGLSIDRIDPNGNYSPENCQWITIEENRKRSNEFNRLRKLKLVEVSE